MNTESLRISAEAKDDQVVWTTVYRGWAETPAAYECGPAGTSEFFVEYEVDTNIQIGSAFTKAKEWATDSGFKVVGSPRPNYGNTFEIKLRRP